MIYKCGACGTMFQLFPGEGYIGPDIFIGSCCPTSSFIIRCKDCDPTTTAITSDPRTFYLEDELLNIVLDVNQRAAAAVINSFDNHDIEEHLEYIKEVADALRFEDPKKLGEVIYPKAREALMDIIEDLKSNGTLDHPSMRDEDE